MLTISLFLISILLVGVLLFALVLELINDYKANNFFIFFLSLLKFGEE
jgi:hypothetical protein